MSPDQPQIKIADLPKEEQALGWSIETGLLSLGRYTKTFREALSLFQFCQAQQSASYMNQNMNHESFPDIQIFSGWSLVAARDGAMSIYHFMCAMECVKACLHRCPTLKANFNPKTSKEATKLFSANFPHCEQMRHAIAHQAELTESPEKFSKNAYTGSFNGKGIKLDKVANVMISDYLDNDVYHTTINGSIISYYISETTYNYLYEIKNKLYSAFEK